MRIGRTFIGAAAHDFLATQTPESAAARDFLETMAPPLETSSQFMRPKAPPLETSSQPETASALLVSPNPRFAPEREP